MVIAQAVRSKTQIAQLEVQSTSLIAARVVISWAEAVVWPPVKQIHVAEGVIQTMLVPMGAKLETHVEVVKFATPMRKTPVLLWQEVQIVTKAEDILTKNRAKVLAAQGE